MQAFVSGIRRSRFIKSLRVVGLFGRAGFLVTVRFPSWQKPQRLAAIQNWARQVLAVLEIEIHIGNQKPPPAEFAGLVVSNHLSWLDILVLQSLMPGAFVAKTEVKRWPVVGYLAQACATVFVDRSSPRSAHSMVEDTAAAIAQGYAVVVFPEGTSSNGQSLGTFHANIFESAIRADSQVQLMTLKYLDRSTGESASSAHFIDDMTLLASIQSVMAQSTIQARVQIGECISAIGHSRKTLAQLSHAKIRAQLL